MKYQAKKCPVCHTKFMLDEEGHLPRHGGCLGGGLVMVGPFIKSGLTMRQSVKVRIAPEVQADLEAIENSTGTVVPATEQQRSDWLDEFRKECPECFNKKLGAKLGPAIRMD